jgi:hypothetical protein
MATGNARAAMNRAPLITATVLLLLPVLYVGSYLTLVVPASQPVLIGVYQDQKTSEVIAEEWMDSHYRWGHRIAGLIFWPLEQIDRRVRPGAWEPERLPPPSRAMAGP